MTAVGLFDVTQFYGRRSWHPYTRAEENKRAGAPGLPALGSPPQSRLRKMPAAVLGLSPRPRAVTRGVERRERCPLSWQVVSAPHRHGSGAGEHVQVLWEHQKQSSGAQRTCA